MEVLKSSFGLKKQLTRPPPKKKMSESPIKCEQRGKNFNLVKKNTCSRIKDPENFSQTMATAFLKQHTIRHTLAKSRMNSIDQQSNLNMKQINENLSKQAKNFDDESSHEMRSEVSGFSSKTSKNRTVNIQMQMCESNLLD